MLHGKIKGFILIIMHLKPIPFINSKKCARIITTRVRLHLNLKKRSRSRPNKDSIIHCCLWDPIGDSYLIMNSSSRGSNFSSRNNVFFYTCFNTIGDYHFTHIESRVIDASIDYFIHSACL